MLGVARHLPPALIPHDQHSCSRWCVCNQRSGGVQSFGEFQCSAMAFYRFTSFFNFDVLLPTSAYKLPILYAWYARHGKIRPIAAFAALLSPRLLPCATVTRANFELVLLWKALCHGQQEQHGVDKAGRGSTRKHHGTVVPHGQSVGANPWCMCKTSFLQYYTYETNMPACPVLWQV